MYEQVGSVTTDPTVVAHIKIEAVRSYITIIAIVGVRIADLVIKKAKRIPKWD